MNPLSHGKPMVSLADNAWSDAHGNDENISFVGKPVMRNGVPNPMYRSKRDSTNLASAFDIESNINNQLESSSSDAYSSKDSFSKNRLRRHSLDPTGLSVVSYCKIFAMIFLVNLCMFWFVNTVYGDHERSNTATNGGDAILVSSERTSSPTPSKYVEESLKRIAEWQERMELMETEQELKHLDSASITVLDSILRFSDKERWVYLCDFTGCNYNKSQEMILAHMLSDIVAKQTNENKFLRVVQLGTCTDQFALQIGNSLAKWIEYFKIFPIGNASSGTEICKHRISNNGDTIKGMSVVSIESKDPLDAKFVRSITDKSVDVVIFDLSVADNEKLFPLLQAWIPKLRTNGIAFGHGFGVEKALQMNPAISWIVDGSYGAMVPFLSATSDMLKQFMQDSYEKVYGKLFVGDDTTWYMLRKRVSFADLTNSNGGKP